MKRFFKLLPVALTIAILAFAMIGCANYSEVAGTYKMSSIDGTVSGVTVTTDMYEYFEITLNANGNGHVRSKGKGVGAAEYEADGTFTYADGVIKMTTKVGAMSATETYDYADGVISYTINANDMNFTVKFTRVEE